MGIITDQLVSFRYLTKLNGLMMKELSDEFHLSDMEINVIAFLHNNPRHDTAADIVELRRLSKSNVSKAVSSLCSKGLLVTKTYESDRRKTHLILTAEAYQIEQEISSCVDRIFSIIFSGFSEQEVGLFINLNKRIGENALMYMEKRNG